MKQLIQRFFGQAKFSRPSNHEQYLAEATSLEDLERRQKNLTYGRAPYQLPMNFFDRSYSWGQRS